MTDLNTLTQKKTLLLGGIILLAIGLGFSIGYAITAQPQQPSNGHHHDTPTTPTPTIEFNKTTLINSHQTSLSHSTPYQLTFTTTRTAENTTTNNTTQPFYVEQTTVMQNATYTYKENKLLSQTTEYWYQNNSAYLHHIKENRTQTVTTTNLENKQTKYLFLQQVLSIGTYKYTTISITNESHFTLTKSNTTQPLISAYPGLRYSQNATVTNVSINGTVENGIITTLNGTFDYKPAPENATTITYEFTLTFDTTTQKQIKPEWVTRYQQTQHNTTQTNTTKALSNPL